MQQTIAEIVYHCEKDCGSTYLGHSKLVIAFQVVQSAMERCVRTTLQYM